MCGICGKLNFNGEVVNQKLILSMCKTLVHRGPDDEGIYIAPYIGLGQRRLSIIDLRSCATPPLSNEKGTLWVVFNGEIYNFIDLRTELKKRGHIFSTATDTEVIVHLYEEYGTRCLEKMRGMFAFALWDADKKMLFAARDRLGKKPFYYAKTGNFLNFGSEIKAITADPKINVEPNYSAIDAYLTYQYVPSPYTAFRGILKLPPAHYLTCGVDGDLKVERYWSVPHGENKNKNKNKANLEELEEELLIRMREAVRLRMIADVPLGAFLSGGIDSGLIVALLSRESSESVKTFSIGFEEEEFNELPYARLVADRYSTDHHEFMIKPEASEVLPLLVYHYNEPFADISALPTYYVAKITREYVKVALSGDGGDENFCGYNNYTKLMKWSKLDFIPYRLRQVVTSNISAILNKFPPDNTIKKISKACFMAGSLFPDRHLFISSTLKPEEKQECYTFYFKSLLRNQSDIPTPLNWLDWNGSMDMLDWMMNYDLTYYLPDCLMVKTDRASMANSLEVRCPFLDHKFLEFTSTIPSSMKLVGNKTKFILRDAVKHLLPTEVINKPKAGFSVPIAKWFRGELLELLRSNLIDETANKRNMFQSSFIKRLIDEHLSMRRDWSSRLWPILILEMWFREFID